MIEVIIIYIAIGYMIHWVTEPILRHKSIWNYSKDNLLTLFFDVVLWFWFVIAIGFIKMLKLWK